MMMLQITTPLIHLLENMEQLIQFLLLLLLLAAATSLLLKTVGKKNLRPPGPWRLPIVGNLHLLDPNRPHRSLLTLSLKHGPLMLLQLGSIPTLVISSRNIAEEIFSHHDLTFSGRPSLFAAKKMSYNFSGMSFAPYGEPWRQARRISMLELLSPGRVRAFEAVRMEEVAKLVAAIRALSGAANLSELTLSLANNVVCRVTVGEEYGVRGYGGEGGVWLHDVLSEAQRLLGGFWMVDYFPAMGWVDRLVLRLHSRLEKNFQELGGFCDEAIQGHLSTKKAGEKSETVEQNMDGADYLQALLRQHKVAEGSGRGGFLSSIDHVKAIISEVFIAGTDTSSSTITWTMTELIRNPRVMIKLQQELQLAAAAGDHTDDKNSGEVMNIIHERDLEKLEYLKQVIKESLRLHAPVPLLVPRETIEPCEIHGFKIPAKTRVLINAFAISTDPSVWEKPLEFWPERFHGDGADFTGQSFEYLPFGAGRRRCPGAGFATVLVQLAVANLVHCFDWSMEDGMKAEDMNMDERIGITVHKKQPLCLIARYKW